MKHSRIPLAAIGAAALMAADPGAAGGGNPPSGDGAKQPKQPKQVEARVLVDCAYGRINDIVTVDADVAASAPELDPHNSAVRQARIEQARAAAAAGEVVE